MTEDRLDDAKHENNTKGTGFSGSIGGMSASDFARYKTEKQAAFDRHIAGLRQKQIAEFGRDNARARAWADVLTSTASHVKAGAVQVPAAVLAAPSGSAAQSPARHAPAAGRRTLEQPNPKVWARDLRPIQKRPDTNVWLSRCSAEARNRDAGDVSPAIIVRVAQLLVRSVRARGLGLARDTMRGMASLAIVSKETVRKAIRWLESRGLIETINTLERVQLTRRVAGGQQTISAVHRGANAYVLRGEIADKPAAADPDDVATADNRPRPRPMAIQISAWAQLLGLVPRSNGVNVGAPLRT